MPATTTLEIDGAQITVDTSALFRAWLEKHLGRLETPPSTCPIPRADEKYVGSIIEPDGRQRHIFLLPGEEKKNWSDSWKWAQAKGGDLPDRIEQAMLYAFMPDEFQKEAYWSSTQHASVSNNAWFQDFYNGNQYSYDKSCELRVRAVRREFSDSVI